MIFRFIKHIFNLSIFKNNNYKLFSDIKQSYLKNKFLDYALNYPKIPLKIKKYRFNI